MHQEGLLFEVDILGGEVLVCRQDVIDLEVEDRRRVVELRLFGDAQHQPYAAAHQKRHVAGAEQVLQAENVAIEGGGAVEVMGVHRDLADPRNRQGVAHVSSPGIMRMIIS